MLSGMAIDTDRIDDAVLALLYLGLHDGWGRAHDPESCEVKLKITVSAVQFRPWSPSKPLNGNAFWGFSMCGARHPQTPADEAAM